MKTKMNLLAATFLALGLLVSGAAMAAEGPQALWADFDGDGALDLYLTGGEGGDRLLLDSGGFLEDHTATAGLEGRSGSLAAFALDLDGAGPVDLALVDGQGKLSLFLSLDGSFADVSEDPGTLERALGTVVEHGGSSLPLGDVVTAAATLRCADGLVDQRQPSNCLEASSTPQQGKLHPLSQDLNVAFAGSALGGPSLEFFGNGWPYQLGFSADSAGDVNGDGAEDIIVGIHNDSAVITSNGRADVYSGLDGSLLHTWSGSQYQAYLGNSVSGAGDVDDDGTADVIVGEPFLSQAATDPGYAHVFSGADGSLIHTLAGVTAGDEFGAAVDGMGDLNGDGHADLLVGAPVRSFASGDGYARVLSGADGSVLFHLSDGTTGSEFGTAVANAGDVNNDGKADMVVGAPAAAGGKGEVRVFSGADGSLLYTFQGDVVPDYLGFSVDGAEDVNNDGHADVIAGAPFGPTGFARVYSGKTGAVLHTFTGSASGDYLGRAVDGVGDLNGDGKPDLLVGAPQGLQGDGYIRLYSGADGSVLLQFDSVPGAQEAMGLSVGHVGTALLINSPNDDTGANLGGAVRVYDTQFVGMGTTSPGERLTVTGVVAADLGGFKFPDGTVQTEANTPGPQGPDGPAGPQGPKGITGPPGGGVQAINGIANQPVTITGGGAFTATASGSTIHLRLGPALCVDGSKSYSQGAICYTNVTSCTTGIGWRATKRTCLSTGSWQNSTSSQCFNPSPLPLCGQ